MLHPVVNDSRRRRLRLAAALLLSAGGAFLLGQTAGSVLRLEATQRADRLRLAAAAYDPGHTVPVSANPDKGELHGRLTIPTRKITASIREGVDPNVLDVAAGHLPGTALPGEPGNSAIAAHRDQLFSGLSTVAEGDLIHIDTPSGRFTYEITELSVVDPDDLSVLAPRGSPTLTLITCYPFTYVGPAPQRFVVHASLTAGVAVGREPLNNT